MAGVVRAAAVAAVPLVVRQVYPMHSNWRRSGTGVRNLAGFAETGQRAATVTTASRRPAAATAGGGGCR